MKGKLLALIITAAALPSPTVGESITSIDIVERSASIDCLDWCVTGVCFWLVCSPIPPMCWIETTPKISHNLPDLIVTAYDEPGDTPWTEMRATTGKLAATALEKVLEELAHAEAGGNLPLKSSVGEESLMQFKESQVVGSPVAGLTQFDVPFLCRSKAEPYLPYFMSEADGFSWRSGLPDSLTPQALTPGVREIGTWPSQTWGAVYPRSGFVQQPDDAKSSAVIAQRAIDVVTREGQPHIYVPYGWDGEREMIWGDRFATSKEECEKSGGDWSEVSDNVWQCFEQRSVQWLPGSNEATDKWQMISPVVSDHCEAFGAAGDWSTGKISEDGRYAWNYWRPYKCCIPGPGLFLTSIDTPPVCLTH